MKLSCVYVVGAFPPPVHGMSSVNAAVYGRLAEMGSEPVKIDLASPSLDRAWHARLYKIRRLAAGLAVFLKNAFRAKNGALYIGLSGGYGQLFELPFVFLARMFGLRIYLHHHSYAYLNIPHIVAGTLFYIAGPKAVHIALCDDMAKSLKQSYTSVGNAVVISNAVLIEERPDPAPHRRTSLKTIGFLSNISYEKGILEFLDIAARLEAEQTGIYAIIAGPFQDEEVKVRVLKRIGALKNAEYVGPRYGGDKQTFYDSIDGLIFPTNYVNEAEPLTIHEAMSHGVPVIARARGCILNMLTSPAGLVIDQDDDFVARAMRQLMLWRSSPEAYCDAVRRSSAQFLAMRASYAATFKLVLTQIAASIGEQGPCTR